MFTRHFGNQNMSYCVCTLIWSWKYIHILKVKFPLYRRVAVKHQCQISEWSTKSEGFADLPDPHNIKGIVFSNNFVSLVVFFCFLLTLANGLIKQHCCL